MPRVCSICTHQQRASIDRALVSGDSFRRIATDFGVSAEALRRHKRDHLPKTIVKAQQAADTVDADDLLQQVRALRNKSITILQRAERAGEYRAALQGVREARACIELLLEVEGELDRRNIVNVVLSPQWVTLRTVIIQALAPYPDARMAVGDAIAHLEAAAP